MTSAVFAREYAALAQRVRSILQDQVPPALLDPLCENVEKYLKNLSTGYEQVVHSGNEIEVYIAPYAVLIKRILAVVEDVRIRILVAGLPSKQLDKLQDIYERYVTKNPEYDFHKKAWTDNIKVYDLLLRDQNNLTIALNEAARRIELDMAGKEPWIYLNNMGVKHTILDNVVQMTEVHAKRCMTKGGQYQEMASQVEKHYSKLLALEKK